MYKLIINLKTYKEGSAINAVKIAKICKELKAEAKNKKVEIILCPQLIDLKDITKEGVSVYAQHIDNVDYGASTGFIVPETIKKAGAKGSLINHSEHRVEFDKISALIKRAKQAGLISCVCAKDTNEAGRISKLNPDFIAVEPPELIGGDISVSTAKPELIKKSAQAVGKIPLLIGAGVKNSQDVRTGIELGAKGILVASGVVKAKNVKGAILDLLNGF